MHLSVRLRSTRLSFGALALSLSLFPIAAKAQDSAAAKAPGIYNEEQATRGDGIFSKTCIECHTRKDMSGADFRLNWNGRTVFELFDRIRTTMPEAAPGSMTREEYADVTAYLLKLNGMPAGPSAMPGDSTTANTKIDIPAPPSQLLSRAGMLVRLPSSPRAAMLGGPDSRGRHSAGPYLFPHAAGSRPARSHSR